MQQQEEHFYVVTGGPGSGKSSLIEALHQRGYDRSIEAGRAIIRNQMAIGGRALPWVDPLLFADLMLSWEMRSYSIAQPIRRPVFFDRGVPDVLGYLHMSGFPIPEHARVAAENFRYSRTVFVAPPWREIFCGDNERRQDFDIAVRTYESISAIYATLNYDLVELPRVTIDERVKFVLRSLSSPIRVKSV